MKTFSSTKSKRGISLVFMLVIFLPMMTLLFSAAFTRVGQANRRSQIEVARAQARLLAESAHTLYQSGAKLDMAKTNLAGTVLLEKNIDGIGQYALVSDGHGGAEAHGRTQTAHGLYQIDCTLGATGYQYSLRINKH